MTTETKTQNPHVHLERTYPAPVERVREAWTNPTHLAKWFAPGPMTCTVQSYDVKVGGQFEITMHGDDGDYTATGTFESVGDNHIHMTWNWTGEGAMPEASLLKATYEPVEGGTKLTLHHERFPNAEAATNHEEGWLGCMENLATFLAA